MIQTAIRAAVAAYRDPGNVARHAHAGLPEGMADLIALLVASDDEALPLADDLGLAVAELRRATRFFMLHAVYFPGADDYRLVGCAPGASRDEMRRNRRMLLMWLHPDAGRFDGDGALYQRLNDAWRRIEAGEAIAEPSSRAVAVRRSTPPRPERPAETPRRHDGRDGRARRSTGGARRRNGFARPALPRHPVVSVARFFLGVILGFAGLTLCVFVLMEVAALRRHCPTVMSDLPFCQFGADDVAGG